MLNLFGCSYLTGAPLTHMCSTRPAFKWVPAQGRSPDTPGGHKNALGLVGIPLKKEHLRCPAINLALSRWVGAWRDGPMRLEESVSLDRPITTNNVQFRPNHLPQNGWSEKDLFEYTNLLGASLRHMCGARPSIK